jgi:hypothetical protein
MEDYILFHVFSVFAACVFLVFSCDECCVKALSGFVCLKM